MLKKILLGLILVLLVIQFIRPAKNAAVRASPNDVVTLYPTPPAVKQLLAVACYDCHSNATRYPWYAELQPLGWWLASHVTDGKHALNFSEVGGYTAKTAARRLNLCADEIADHSMPLFSYRLIHADARLSEAQIKILTDWFEQTSDFIKEKAALAPPPPRNPEGL